MNLKNGGTTDFDYNSVLGTSGTYIRFSMFIPNTHPWVDRLNRNISQKYSVFAMFPKLSCLVIIVFLINLSLQWEIVEKVWDGKKTVLVEGRKTSMVMKKVACHFD